MTHVYDSGIYFDTYPDDAIGCCPLPIGHPVHDIKCERCGDRKSARHDEWCPKRGAA